jgi:hypothetical protein
LDQTGPLVHRALDPDSVRVRADGTPLFAGWRWARLTPAQTVSSNKVEDALGNYAAPEVRAGGLAAATPSSDLFSLCAVLLDISPPEQDAPLREVLSFGLERDPERRPGPLELAELLTDQTLQTQVAPEGQLGAPPPPSRWDEGHVFSWKDDRYRVLSVLGHGGAGRTFKLEQLNEVDEPIGTYVAR